MSFVPVHFLLIYSSSSSKSCLNHLENFFYKRRKKSGIFWRDRKPRWRCSKLVNGTLDWTEIMQSALPRYMCSVLFCKTTPPRGGWRWASWIALSVSAGNHTVPVDNSTQEFGLFAGGGGVSLLFVLSPACEEKKTRYITESLGFCLHLCEREHGEKTFVKIRNDEEKNVTRRGGKGSRPLEPCFRSYKGIMR